MQSLHQLQSAPGPRIFSAGICVVAVLRSSEQKVDKPDLLEENAGFLSLVLGREEGNADSPRWNGRWGHFFFKLLIAT